MASPNPSARIEFAGGTQGWPGDVPLSRIKPDKLAALGFKVKNTSDRAVELAGRARTAMKESGASPFALLGFDPIELWLTLRHYYRPRH